MNGFNRYIALGISGWESIKTNFQSPILPGTSTSITLYSGGSQASYPFQISGTSGGAVRTTTGYLNVSGTPVSPPTVSCAASPANVAIGQTTQFQATVSGGTPPYTYSWTGSFLASTQSVSFTPQSAGFDTALLTVTDSNGATAQTSCTVAVQEPINVTTNVPSSVSVTAGQSVQFGITSTALNGYSGSVTYGYNPANWQIQTPAGPANTIAANFSPFTPSGAPWSSTVTIYTTGNTPPGSYSLPIFASGGGAQQFANIILTVNPPTKPLQQAHEEISLDDVTIYSEIIVYPPSSASSPGQISVQAYTLEDYNTEALYDAEVDSALYQGDGPYPCSQPTSQAFGNPAEATFCGSSSAPTILNYSQGEDFYLASEHYLIFVTEVTSTIVYGNPGEIYEDPYGFSLLPVPDAGDGDIPPVDTIQPAAEDVYVEYSTTDLGPTSDYKSTADQSPVITSISPTSITPDPNVTTYPVVTIYGSNFGPYGPASGITLSGDSNVTYAINTWSDNGQPGGSTIQLILTVQANATQGDRSITVTSGGSSGYQFFAQAGRNATSNPVYLGVSSQSYQVSLAPGSGYQDPMNPNQMNLSTGDMGKYVTTTVSPNNITFTPNFTNQFLLDNTNPNNSNSNCYPTLSFSSGSGQGSVNSTVTANSYPCGGIFRGAVLAGPAGHSSNAIEVVVPPEVLIQMIWGEANGQGAIGDNTSELAVGVAARNRSSQPGFNTAINSTQFKGVGRAINSNVYNGPNPELNNAVAVFTRTTSVTVANAGCFFTPTAYDWANIIGPQLLYQTMNLVQASNDPGCYTKPNTPYGQQYLVKQSIANNSDGRGAPAFIFVQKKPSAPAPAVILIP